MSILSELPDGCGFFYGFYKGDYRQINVRFEHNAWVAYVGGEKIYGHYSGKQAAEDAAIAYIKANPEPSNENSP